MWRDKEITGRRIRDKKYPEHVNEESR